MTNGTTKDHPPPPCSVHDKDDDDRFHCQSLSFQTIFRENGVPSTNGHTRLQPFVFEAAQTAYAKANAATRLKRLLADVKGKRCVPLVDLSSVTRQVENLYETTAAAGDDDVVLFYPTKTNYDEGVLRTLVADSRVKFDCSGVYEMKRCLEAGASPDRVAFFNPFKSPADVMWALRNGIRLFDLDSVNEVRSMERTVKDFFGTEGKSKVEVLVRTTQVRDEPDIKFGVDEGVVNDLIDELAKTNHLDLIGFHFHIGSHEKKMGSFAENIEYCDRAATRAVDKGFVMKMLDVGGGFPDGATNENEELFRAYVKEIAEAKSASKHFRDAVTVYEGGTYTVGAAVVVAIRVVSVKPSVPVDDKGTRLQIVIVQNGDSGLFGLYTKEYIPFTLYPPVHVSDGDDDDDDVASVPENSSFAAWPTDDEGSSAPRYWKSVVHGPTCDETDRLTIGPTDCPHGSEPLPACKPGDWLVFPAMGAYAQNYKTTFCGFVPEPSAYYWSTKKENVKGGVGPQVRELALVLNAERKPVHPADIEVFRTESLFSMTLECAETTRSVMETSLAKFDSDDNSNLTVFTCGAGESAYVAASVPGVKRVVNVDINEITAAIALLKWRAVNVLTPEECATLLTRPGGEAFVRKNERRPLLDKCLAAMPAESARLISPTLKENMVSQGVDGCGEMAKCYVHGGQCLAVAGLHPILNANDVDWDDDDNWEKVREILVDGAVTCPVSEDVKAFRGDSFADDMMPRLRVLRTRNPEAFRGNIYARYFLGLGSSAEHDDPRAPVWKKVRDDVRTTSECGDLLGSLRSLEEKVHFVDLSNIPECLPNAVLQELADLLAKKVVPGGTILYRNHSSTSLRDTFDAFLYATKAFDSGGRQDLSQEESTGIYLETVALTARSE